MCPPLARRGPQPRNALAASAPFCPALPLPLPVPPSSPTLPLPSFLLLRCTALLYADELRAELHFRRDYDGHVFVADSKGGWWELRLDAKLPGTLLLRDPQARTAAGRTARSPALAGVRSARQGTRWPGRHRLRAGRCMCPRPRPPLCRMCPPAPTHAPTRSTPSCPPSDLLTPPKPHCTPAHAPPPRLPPRPCCPAAGGAGHQRLCIAATCNRQVHLPRFDM